MPVALKYAARALLVIGVVLLVRALSLIFLPTTAAVPSPTPIQDLLLRHFLVAGLVLAAGLVSYFFGRSRKAVP